MFNHGGIACEPLRTWNRLEPRCRKHDFDEVLKSCVYDPLWMLTRQWQFGEFQGEDTGSAIFAKINIESTPVLKYKAYDTDAELYSDSVPLEVQVESESLTEDFFTAVESGMFFIKLLDNSFKTWVHPYPDYSFIDYLEKSQRLFPIDKLIPVLDSDTAEETIRKLKQSVNSSLNIFQSSFENKGIDGRKIYLRNITSPSELLSDLQIIESHSEVLSFVIKSFSDWYGNKYKNQGSVRNAPSWKKEQMEYQFAIAFPEKDRNNSVLIADEYYTGHLDWYSFDIQSDLTPVTGLSGESSSDDKEKIINKTISVIPTTAKYSGMPNARFWQFEEGSVNLTKIDADTTDLAKIIVSEFALVYSNDWMIVPYSIPVGSLTTVKGILITDVFGECSFIQSVIQGQTDDWSSWGYFNLSVRHPENIRNEQVDTRLFIPPATVKTLESEPFEEVYFVRDEMTNLVWGIENKLDNRCGGNMDGYTQASILRNAVESLEPPDSIHPVDESAMFKYTIQNTVPENWIPFVPVQISGQQRAIMLQRAAMPRWFRNSYLHVRPDTAILREGIDSNDVVTQSLFIHEEEVPRTGIKVMRSNQLTRWYNGQIYTWVGRQKKPGRGEGSSGLKFDSLTMIKK